MFPNTIYEPTFVHYIVYSKSNTNFHFEAFRHLLMPSSGNSVLL